MTDTIMTTEFRILYHCLFNKQPVQKDKPEGKKAYKLSMGFEKSNPETKVFVDSFRKTCAQAIAKTFPDVDKDEIKKYVMGDPTCELTQGGNYSEFNDFVLMDGDRKELVKKYPQNAGHFTLSAKRGDSKNNEAVQPGLVYLTPEGEVLDLKDPRMIKSGDYGLAELTYYVYGANEGDKKKGVTLGLTSVCRIREGEALAANAPADGKKVFASVAGKYAPKEQASFEEAEAVSDDGFFDE